MSKKLYAIDIKSKTKSIELPHDHELVDATPSRLIITSAFNPKDCEHNVTRTFQILGCNDDVSAEHWQHIKTFQNNTFITHLIEHLDAPLDELSAIAQELNLYDDSTNPMIKRPWYDYVAQKCTDLPSVDEVCELYYDVDDEEGYILVRLCYIGEDILVYECMNNNGLDHSLGETSRSIALLAMKAFRPLNWNMKK
jgi:hypothetical protein